jgi:serpin B
MMRAITGLAVCLAVTAGGVRAVDGPTKAGPAAVVGGNSRFAFDLYAKLRQEKGNLFVSPYNISAALAMTYAGAKGETAEQMAKVLHFPDGDKLHPSFGSLIHQINGGGNKKGYELATANALWGQQGYGFLPEYLQLVKQNYGGGLKDVDFIGATEEARKTINAWVERQTQDKIKELLHKGDVDPLTRLVLTNAIYFKGAWMQPFPKGATKDEPFYLAADRKLQTPLMHQTAHLGYAEGDGLQALELPYAGGDLSLLVLLPKEKGGLAELEKKLTTEMVAGVVGRLRPREVQVALPRFKTTARFELRKVLSDMGMPRAFDDDADFSGMTGRRDLWISKVIHQAFVDVNEEGTEAAAATAVVMATPGAVDSEPAPVFRADHPFVFLIRDTRSGSILFLGRLADPKE